MFEKAKSDGISPRVSRVFERGNEGGGGEEALALHSKHLHLHIIGDTRPKHKHCDPTSSFLSSRQNHAY
jgi:hypothetical protein